MPVDTSIYSRVSKGGNLGDLVENYNKGVELRQQRKLSDLALSKAEREAAQGKALNDAYASNISPDGKINRQGMISQLSAGGHGMAIPQLQQAWSTQDKSEAETLEKRLDVAKKQVDYFHGTMAGLLALPEITDDALIRATSNAVNRGYISQDQGLEFIRNIPPDQTSRRAILMDGIAQSVDAKKQLEMFSPKVSAQNLGGHTQMVDTNPLTNPGVVGQRLEWSATPGDLITDRHYRASEGLQARGQNMADARARESNATALSRPFEVTGPDGKPMLVQQDKAGNIRPVTNYMPKKSQDTLTEGERKAATLLQRLEFSEKQLQKATSENAEAKKPELAASAVRSIGLETAANAMTGEQRQRVESAQLDILDAALTLGTGAAYTREQLEGYRRSYFPQIGDSAKTVKDKNARLKNVIEAARIAAGRAGTKGQGNDASDRTDEEPKIVDFSDLK